MTSALFDEFRGLGFKMAHEELDLVNVWREQMYQDKPKPVLTASPGLIIKEVGQHREGYWKSEDFNLQINDFMDCVECLYGDIQVINNLDNSLYIMLNITLILLIVDSRSRSL